MTNAIATIVRPPYDSRVTSGTAQPQRVRRRHRAEALQCLAGGRRRDLQAALRADALGEMLTRSGMAGQLWQVCREGECVAAALVIPSAGRVGVVYHSPAEAPGVDAAALSSALSAAANAALKGGAAFVQALIGPKEPRDAKALLGAGFVRLAGLSYLQRDLAESIPPGAVEGVAGATFVPCRPFDPAEMGPVILGTYAGSLDCPPLAHFRQIEDVLASHKASGNWRPDLWWIVRVGGAPAGCVLVNESATCPGDADLVYMGLLPHYRGRGLGRAMVRYACGQVRREGRERMHVVVDTSNPYAVRIYEAEGFRATHERVAYIRREVFRQ